MKDERLVKDLTVQELKDIIRQTLRDEIRYVNIDAVGKPIVELKEMKPFPKKFTITCEEDQWL